MRPQVPERLRGRVRVTLGFAYVSLALLTSLLVGAGEPARLPASGQQQGRTEAAPRESSCVYCHRGIEEMHPAAELTCVECHGGDPTTKNKFESHVQPVGPLPEDERVAPLDWELAYRQFVNPMDMRVVSRTCGSCHADMIRDLEISLHGTTAGHLSDGFYEIGAHPERGSKYSVFPIRAKAHERSDSAGLDQLIQVPQFRPGKKQKDLATHYADLARKECMQCHLYSPGRAVRGRVGFDGDYRGDGCAACHVPYGRDGLSKSRDRSLDKNEPGHPLRHEMTRAPSTDTCTSCHYGDASIGLHFRGLSQLPPGAAGGPEDEGTTDTLLNRAFYLNDNTMTPPDIHHEMGMHCVDCHTIGDVMGDGKMHGQMEYAVEISCESCHGTFDAKATLRTERGTPLEHLALVDDEVWLTSKVTGEKHLVTQVVDVLDPEHIDYNPRAKAAMTSAHGNLECYTCHAGWNVNFLGFHFYRNEALSQLDLITGARTPGRGTTQEKVFSTWKSFYAGLNEEGRVAPYLTGFATMGTVDGPDGERILDQVMPETAAGLSGMSMVHHQLHSTRPTARTCVECHRTSATWGMGSNNFRLARQLAFVADRRGIEVVAVNRAQLASSTPLAKIVLPDVVDIEIESEPIQGSAQYLYVTEGGRGVHVIDVRDPAHPVRIAFQESVSPRGMALCGEHLLVADGIGGLKVYDVSEPQELTLVAQLPTFDAHEVHLSWPWAYVADGIGGLAIVDVSAPVAPRLVGGLELVQGRGQRSMAIDVETLFQYSRPRADMDDTPLDMRSAPRNLAAVCDQNRGLFLIDVTEPSRPEIIYPRATGRSTGRQRGGVLYRGLSMLSHVDLASPQGGDTTRERDYVYLISESQRGQNQNSTLNVMDVTRGISPRRVGRVEAGFSTEMVVPMQVYNQPFLQTVMLTPGLLGVFASDVTTSSDPTQLGAFGSIREAYVVALEEFPLDKMIDERGTRLKDISHPRSRWLFRAEIEKLMGIDGVTLGTIDEDDEAPETPGGAVRPFFVRHDSDMNGLLTGEEVEGAGGRSADRNGDGRITLLELSELGGQFGGKESGTGDEEESPFLTTRVDANGDLARLLDGLDPHQFDRNTDRRLDRRETEKAFFEALDLDEDKRLSRAELSRHPGALRQLRYGDDSALERFDVRDLNRGGTVSLREFRLREEDFAALDVDGNDFVQLPLPRNRTSRETVNDLLPNEWPYRRALRLNLPPTITAERLYELFDDDGDMRLSGRELRSRADLLRQMDVNSDGAVDRDELAGVVARVTQVGVDLVPDTFEGRWDLDRDGKVEEGEVPAEVWPILERVTPAR